MKLSIIIPVHNEENCISDVIKQLLAIIISEKIDYEIVVVNDASTDSTGKVLSEITENNPNIKIINKGNPTGFGLAIKEGLKNFSGDAVTIVMGDGSDDPEDIIKYYKKICEGYDCVFGSRFITGSNVIKYPEFKLRLNRFGNYFISKFFSIKHNDITNAFKCYSSEIIKKILPLNSNGFEITIEMPLKMILFYNCKFATVPINWYGRKAGKSKMKILVALFSYLKTALIIRFNYLWRK